MTSPSPVRRPSSLRSRRISGPVAPEDGFERVNPPRIALPGVVVDSSCLLNGRIRRETSDLRRRGRIRLIWSPRLIAEFIRTMTEYETYLRQEGQATRDHMAWKGDVDTMMNYMEADYEVVSSQPDGPNPDHAARNLKDALTWWTAVHGHATYILSDDRKSRPTKREGRDQLPIKYVGLDDLIELL